MKTLICLIALLAASAANAAVDLDACTRDGQPIAAQLCQSLRQVDASNKRREADQVKATAAAQHARDRSAAFEAQQAQLRQADAERAVSARAAAAEEEAYWNDRSDALKRSVAATQRDVERQEAVARKVCGAEYGRPAVGMSLTRAQNCLGDVRLVGQVNRADGVASVYSNGRVQLVVMNARVVAWQGL